MFSGGERGEVWPASPIRIVLHPLSGGVVLADPGRAGDGSCRVYGQQGMPGHVLGVSTGQTGVEAGRDRQGVVGVRWRGEDKE